MGLSIYYRFKTKSNAEKARQLVSQLHDFAEKLPFDHVWPVEEYDPPEGKFVFERGEEPFGRKPGDLYLERKRDDGRTENVIVPPLHVVCFLTSAKGSEPAMFGLASHPPVVVHREAIITEFADGGTEHRIGAGKPIEYPTRLRGYYSWWYACKTQYASNPKLGGPDNFLRAHLSIFKMADEAKRLGITTKITDDSGFWKHRDEKKLLAELTRWDEIIAGFAGRLSDRLGNDPERLQAPIKDRPDFEHLEAKGAARLAAKKRSSRRRRK